MAPEQVRGEAVDPRTDIIAFGTVLFAMLSGQRVREYGSRYGLAIPAGILSMSHFYITPSREAYAYSAGGVLSSLYVYSQK